MDLDVEGVDVLLPHDACDAGHGREPLLQADERPLAILVERAVARIDVEAQLEDAIGVGLRRQFAAGPSASPAATRPCPAARAA